MNHLPFTFLAYFLNSVSVTVDKFLLSKNIPNPIVYVFYFSCFSLVALLLLPFTHVPTVPVLILASSSTLLWTTGAFCMFKALQIGLVSRVIPVIGVLIPLFLLIEAANTNSVTFNQFWAICILVVGLVFLTIVDWKGAIKKKELIFEISSAALFAISYLLLRQAYIQETFLTVFAWSRLILLPVGLFLLVIPRYRKIILAQKGSGKPKLGRSGILFIFGQIAGGSSELLLTFSVSLASPALVNSLQGVQYIFLFLFSIILARKFPDIYKERIHKLAIFTKIIGIILICFGLYVLAFFGNNPKKITFGLTYSPKYAAQLGLDPYTTYTKMLDDIRPHYIRLPIYWDQVEQSPGNFDFSSVDPYVQQATQRNVNLIIVVGFKQPRWPECYIPTWANSMNQTDKDQEILKLVQAEVEHFKDNPQIIAWQVENEPYLGFGTCPDPKYSAARLPGEISMVKNLDFRPILITDSGELGGWYEPIKLGDIFGTTLYRKVWSPYFGDAQYPLPPFYYSVKGEFISFLANSHNPQIISELQMEPWQKEQVDLNNVSIDEQLQLFPISQFQNNIIYTKQTNFSSAYLWGVEWWYFMDSKGHPEYLDSARNLFKQ